MSDAFQDEREYRRLMQQINKLDVSEWAKREMRATVDRFWSEGKTLKEPPMETQIVQDCEYVQCAAIVGAAHIHLHGSNVIPDHVYITVRREEPVTVERIKQVVRNLRSDPRGMSADIEKILNMLDVLESNATLRQR